MTIKRCEQDKSLANDAEPHKLRSVREGDSLKRESPRQSWDLQFWSEMTFNKIYT